MTRSGLLFRVVVRSGGFCVLGCIHCGIVRCIPGQTGLPFVLRGLPKSCITTFPPFDPFPMYLVISLPATLWRSVYRPIRCGQPLSEWCPPSSMPHSMQLGVGDICILCLIFAVYSPPVLYCNTSLRRFAACSVLALVLCKHRVTEKPWGIHGPGLQKTAGWSGRVTGYVLA